MTTAKPAALGHMPLYAHVRQVLVDRMISGAWVAGQLVPSEHRLAQELGVSQGTVRKALDVLASEGLLVRQQGRGTFVADAQDNAILFRFYRLTPDAEKHRNRFPASQFLSLKNGKANAREKQLLGNETAEVWRIERLRLIDDAPILLEKIVLPGNRFADLDQHQALPNNLYQLYSEQYGITISKVDESLRAISADARTTKLLALEAGAPLLEIDRLAVSLDGQTIEWRHSLCNTQSIHYRNEL